MGFNGRYANITLRPKEPYLLTRYSGFNRAQLTHCYVILREVTEQRKIETSGLHNMDEACVQTLLFVCLCIANIIPNYNQKDATFLDLLISTDAVNVSGCSSAHRQEHITVHIASGIVNQYCCFLLSWKRWNSLSFHSR